jgi:hypothetical protein
MVLFAVVL